MNQGHTKDSDQKSVRNYDAERWITSSSPGGGGFGISIPKVQPCARLHNPGQRAQDRLLGDRTQVLVPNPLPAEQHEAPAALAGLFPLAAWGFSCPKPTHQHGPAAKHAMEPWHGSWTRSSQELFVIQQPQISQLHSDFTREEQQWCFNPGVLHSTLFHSRPFRQTQALSLPDCFTSSKSTSQAQHSESSFCSMGSSKMSFYEGALNHGSARTGREILQPIFEDRQWLFLLK